MRAYLLTSNSLPVFYNRLASDIGETYTPRVYGRSATYKLWKNDEKVEPEELILALRMVRPVEPLKEFFLASRERVASFPQLFSKDIKPKVIIGPKDCDIRTLIEIQDNVYLKGTFEDPFYKERREKFLLITVDCPDPAKTCFCNAIGGKPYSAWGGDLNLSFTDHALILEVLSPKGEEIVGKLGDILKELPEKELKRRDKIREEAEQKLMETNPEEFPFDLPEKIEEQLDTKFWAETMNNCVDCQACQRICPTCYCFLLYDIPSGKGFERVKVLDYCYHAAYGRVGGGANPMAHFSHRLRNRFECKFMSFPRNFKVMACTGCGRCIVACTAKIDIRNILRSL